MSMMRSSSLSNKTKSTLSIIGLVFISFVWGVGFVIMKDAVSAASPLYVLAFRFGIAAIPLIIIFFKSFLTAKKSDYLRGLLVGLAITAAYLFQAYGAKYTTASKNSLITASYTVFIPFIAWLIFKRKPKLTSILFALVAFWGIGFICIDTFDRINIGDILTLLSGFCLGLQMVLLSEFSKKTSPRFLTVMQFLVGAVICFAFSPLEGAFPTHMFTDPSMLWRVLFLGLVCTLMCILIQGECQKHLSVTISGLIMSSESLFGAFAGVIINSDKFSAMMVIGMVLLIIAIVGEQCAPTIIDKIKKKKTSEDTPLDIEDLPPTEVIEGDSEDDKEG